MQPTQLSKAIGKHRAKHLFEVKRRPKGTASVIGFVVGYSDSLILFHRLDRDTFTLNGFSAIRVEDVSAYRVFDKVAHWEKRAVDQIGLEAILPPDVQTGSWYDMLRSVKDRFGLISVRREIAKPDVCYIGMFAKLTERLLTIDDLNADCEWTGELRLRLADVTRIDFDGGYERALITAAQKRKKSS